MLNRIPRETSEEHAPWPILAIVLLGSLAGTLNLYKVPSLLPLLIQTFQVDRGTAGLLMSVFAAAGIFLSIPGGLILDQLRGRTTGTVAIGFVVAGSALGAFSSHIGLMLFSRLIEGIGLTLISITAPMVIAFRFGRKKRAMALGVFSASFPLASMIVFVAAPLLASQWGWRSVWFFGALYALLAGILYYFFITPAPKHLEATLPGKENAVLQARKTLKNPDIWFTGLLFSCFSAQYSAFLTWTPTFLHSARGASLAVASLFMSILPVVSIITAPLAGWALGKILHRRLTCAIAMTLLALLVPWTSVVPLQYMTALMVVLGIINSTMPPLIMSLVADLAQRGKAGSIPQALVNMGQSAGMLIGPTLFGFIIDRFGGWNTAYWALLPVGMMGAIAALLLRWRLYGRIRAGITTPGDPH